MESASEPILIIALAPLANVVHGLQLAASIKQQRPETRIGWVVKDIFAPLVRASGLVDDVYRFERYGGVGAFVRLVRTLRKTRFSHAFDFSGQLRSALLLKCVHAGVKLGRRDGREGSRLLTRSVVTVPDDAPRHHELATLLQFCPALGLAPTLAPALRFSAAESLALGYLEGERGERPVVMFPDSRRADRRWNGFKELTSLILRDGSGRKVIWVGNQYVNFKEAPPASRFVNLTGNTSLLSLPEIIHRSDWVIANDSGALQLAAAMGVRILGIYGPTDPRLSGPFPLTDPKHHVAQAPVGNLKLLTAKEVFVRFQRLDAPMRGMGSRSPLR